MIILQPIFAGHFLRIIHDRGKKKTQKYLLITWMKAIFAQLTGKTGMDDHFTSNICRLFLKVIHD